MAGTVVLTYQEHRTVKQVVWDWTSDAAGAVSGVDTKPTSGLVLRIVTNPDDTDAPTNLYDIVINDEDSVDVAQGLLANRSATASEEIVPVEQTTIGANNYGSPIAVDGKLSLVVSNAGATKKGRVRLYYR